MKLTTDMSLFKKNIIKDIMKSQGLIIDSHTHVGLSLSRYVKSSGQFCQSLNELAIKMQLYGVDYSMVFPFPDLNGSMIRDIHFNAGHGYFAEEEFPYQLANNYLFSDVIRNDYQMFLPFMLIQPNIKLDLQVGLYEKYKDYIFGFKIHTAANEISPTSLPDDFIGLCKRDRVPIIFHTRSCQPEYSCWSVIEFAQSNPDVNVCVAHCAGFEKSFFKEVNKMDNVYFDISPLLSLCYLALNGNEKVIAKDKLNLDYSNPEEVLRRVYNMAPNKMLWGTDDPCGHFVKNKYQLQVDHIKHTNMEVKKQIQKNVYNFLAHSQYEKL